MAEREAAEPEAAEAMTAASELPDDLPRSIAYDDDELERKLSAAEHDPVLRERDRPPLIVPPPHAATPPPEPAVAPPAPPTPAPAPEPAAEPAPAADVADDPLAAELDKLFSKLSRGPGEPGQ
jgi:hypothetical protein